MKNDSERRRSDSIIIFLWTMDKILHIYIIRLNLYICQKDIAYNIIINYSSIISYLLLLTSSEYNRMA